MTIYDSFGFENVDMKAWTIRFQYKIDNINRLLSFLTIFVLLNVLHPLALFNFDLLSKRLHQLQS